MLQSSHLGDELQALKSDLSRLLGTASDEILDASRAHADALAEQIKAALNDLGETLSHEEDRISDIISERPIATITSAFALGIVVGLMLRRH